MLLHLSSYSNRRRDVAARDVNDDDVSLERGRALRELRRDYPSSPYLFVSELGGPMTPATVRKLITRAGEKAKLPFPIHPHMLRHSTGYKLANDGHDTRSIQQYLGHRNITHTVRYTELSPERCRARVAHRRSRASGARAGSRLSPPRKTIRG